MAQMHHQGEGVTPIIVFDAMCVLCSANAQFVINNDRRGHFLLASMQGEVGSEIYRKFGIDPISPDTIVVVTGNRALRDSDAVLSIYDGLGWPWRMLSAFKIIPGGARPCISTDRSQPLPDIRQARDVLVAKPGAGCALALKPSRHFATTAWAA